MNLVTLSAYVSMAIPWAAFAALLISLFIYVKNKANVDALKEIGETYKGLAEAYAAESEQLKCKIEELNVRIADLERLLELQKDAMKMAIDEILSGIERKKE